MSLAKAEALELIRKMPDSATTADILEELYFKEQVDRGLRDVVEERADHQPSGIEGAPCSMAEIRWSLMEKKLTITLDECVYKGLRRVVGRRRIRRFIATLVCPHVVGEDLEAAYCMMV